MFVLTTFGLRGVIGIYFLHVPVTSHLYLPPSPGWPGPLGCPLYILYIFRASHNLPMTENRTEMAEN
jgi:hypothetical protein